MVSPGHAHTYDALSAKSFEALGPDDLESLLRQCVSSELAQRGATERELEGPPPANVGGADLRLELHAAPNTSRAEFQRANIARPFTFDEVGKAVVYSAKSGKHWKRDALDEAKNGSAWALDALASGGRFVLVMSSINHNPPTPARTKPARKPQAKKPPAKKKSVRRELADAYLKRLRATHPRAADPFSRIEVYDANDLLEYLRNSRPAVSKQILTKLGVAIVDGLLNVAECLKDHERDRSPAPGRFVWDDERTSAAKQLIETLQLVGADRYDRAVWIASPPGVGKTRFVVETLRAHPDFERRTYVAPSVATAAERLRTLIGNLRDAIVVVDDCPEDDVEPTYRAFGQANKDQAAGLILITATEPPSHVPQNLKQLALIKVAPLAASACEALIAQQLGPGDERTPRIAELTHGYPWFAILVARELARDSKGPAPRSLDDVVDLALAPRGTNFGVEVERRAAALFVVMLTEGEVLQDLDTADKGELVQLFDAQFDSWKDLTQTIKACAKRGLLRAGEGGIYRYVTPAILEREVASRILGSPPDPGGPRPFDERLRSSRMRARLQTLLVRLEKLGFPEDILSRVAIPVVSRLEVAAAGIDAIRDARLNPTDLLFAAHHQPTRLAAALRRHIEATSVDDLRSETRLRRPLMFGLASLAGRRSSFEDAEAALFRLALAENESYVNNAIASWAGLFDVAVNATYRTFGEKLSLLESRVRDPEPSRRLVALAAPARLISEHGFKLAGEELDGPYPKSTNDDVLAARITAWRLVLERLHDADAAVRARAAYLLIRHLRSAVRSAVFSTLAASIAHGTAGLTEHELLALRKAADDAERYDRRFLKGPDEERLWAELRASIAPRSFSERLHLQVGTHGHAASLAEEDSLDLDLARVGLENEAPILAEIDWLASSEAVRAIPFGAALGVVDDAGALLEPMMAQAAPAPDLLSSYLRGREQAGHAGTVDRAIDRLRADGLWDAAALAVWRAGATPARVAHLCEDVDAQRASDRVLQMFAWASWQQGLSDDEFERFSRALLGRGPSVAGIALDLLEQRMKAPGGARGRLEPLLLQAFEEVSLADPDGRLAFIWEEAAKLLINAGHSRRVVRAAVRATLLAGDHFVRHEVVGVLAGSAEREPREAWEAIQPVLEADDGARRPLVEACQAAGILRIVPLDTVMAWLAFSVDRATLVASMTPMHAGADLPPIARALVIRFGPTSRPAGVLRGALDTTPRAVASLAQFAEQQLARVRKWQTDSDAGVREFADLAAAELASSRDQFAAHEEYERRRWGRDASRGELDLATSTRSPAVR